jgi:hypothetical protein
MPTGLLGGAPARALRLSSLVDTSLSTKLDSVGMTQGPVTASEAERLLRKAARRIKKAGPSRKCQVRVVGDGAKDRTR